MIHAQGSEPDNRTDAELVAAFRSGENAAAAELHRRHYLKLVRSFATKLPSFEVAEDCVSTAFLRVLEIIRRGKGPTSNVSGYLWSAVSSESVNFYRNNGSLVALNDFDAPVDPPLPDLEEDARVDESSVQAAFRGLPEQWQQLVTLRFVENKKPSEIASILGTEPPTLRKMLHRAKNGLRDAYLEQFAISRSVGTCQKYSNDLVAYATNRLKLKQVEALEAHLADCADCQQSYKEVQHQWRRVSPQALGLVLLLGGVGGGSALTLGGVSEANAASFKAATVAPKLLVTGGLFKTGAAALIVVAAGTLALGTWLMSSAVTSAAQPDPEPTAVTPASPAAASTNETVSTSDGDCDCELTVSTHDGLLRAVATVNRGQCWLSYQQLGGDPRPEVSAQTGWIVETRVPGTYEFEFRSKEDATSYTVTL